jgi:hypothetical protein
MTQPLTRYHGDLGATSAEEHRALRPVGMTRADVVARTDALLTPLIERPGVRIFRSVRLARVSGTASAHAVSAGRTLVLIESVAWPSGRYAMDAAGELSCDGHMIGQSASPLAAAVTAFRDRLPRRHRVRALVAVHRTGFGRYTLPEGTRNLGWLMADHLAAALHDALPRRADQVSRQVLAALTEAGIA